MGKEALAKPKSKAFSEVTSQNTSDAQHNGAEQPKSGVEASRFGQEIESLWEYDIVDKSLLDQRNRHRDQGRDT
jgi:hypothetical protein